MTVTITNVTSEGCVLMGTFEGATIGAGMSAFIAKSLQKVLPKLDVEVVSTDKLNYNTIPEQNPMSIMLLGEPELQVVARDFKIYPLGVKEDGTEFSVLISEEDEHKFLAFGPTALVKEHTSDQCPEGGVNSFPIPVEEWDDFVEAFGKVEFVD